MRSHLAIKSLAVKVNSYEKYSLFDSLVSILVCQYIAVKKSPADGTSDGCWGGKSTSIPAKIAFSDRRFLNLLLYIFKA